MLIAYGLFNFGFGTVIVGSTQNIWWVCIGEFFGSKKGKMCIQTITMTPSVLTELEIYVIVLFKRKRNYIQLSLMGSFKDRLQGTRTEDDLDDFPLLGLLGVTEDRKTSINKVGAPSRAPSKTYCARRGWRVTGYVLVLSPDRQVTTLL